MNTPHSWGRGRPLRPAVGNRFNDSRACNIRLKRPRAGERTAHEVFAAACKLLKLFSVPKTVLAPG
jgi:hypothetical protein